MRLNKLLVKLLFVISVIICLPIVLMTELTLSVFWIIFSSSVYIHNNICDRLSKDGYDTGFVEFNEFIELFKIGSKR